MSTLEMQQALKALGFDPGPVDGIWGRRTRAALIAYQRSIGLAGWGVPGPKTYAGLRAGLGQPAPEAGATSVDAGPGGDPPWYALAMRKTGLHERRDHAEVSEFLRSDGATLGDPAVLPWCGDFVETCIAVSLPDEPIPANPYLARNWNKWGQELRAPALGAVVTFWRGSPDSYKGHVGFYAGEDATNVHVLGGNQSNRVSIARLSKDRLLGYRWPETWPLPGTGAINLPATGRVSVYEE